MFIYEEYIRSLIPIAVDRNDKSNAAIFITIVISLLTQYIYIYI